MYQPQPLAQQSGRLAKFGTTIPLIALCAIICIAPLHGENVISSTPLDPLLPPLQRPSTPQGNSRLSTWDGVTNTIGAVDFHSRLSYSYISAEGLPTQARTRVSSEIQTVDLHLSADLGQHWAIDYNPSWVSYSAADMSDSFDQLVRLSGVATARDWEINFAESYKKSTPTLVETGSQTAQETWASNLAVSYSLSPHIHLKGIGRVNERYTDIAPRVRGWSGQAKLNFIVSPRLDFELGPGFKYTEIADSPDTYGERYTAKLNWRPTEKLSLSLDAGTEKTHSTSSAGLNSTKPVTELVLAYHPFETTSINVDVSKSVSTSYFRNQITEDFIWNVSLHQRLLRRFFLTVMYGRQENDYTSTSLLTPINRSDSIEKLNIQLATKILKRVSISGTFQDTTNDSNSALFSFSSKQYGVRVSCEF